MEKQKCIRAVLKTSNLPDERQARDIVFINVQNPRKRKVEALTSILTLVDCQAIKATISKNKLADNAVKSGATHIQQGT